MKKFLTSLYLSLFNNSEGFSGRKVTAAVLTVCVVALDVRYIKTTDELYTDVFIEALIVHLAAVAFFLALIKVADIVAFRTGIVTKETTTTETVTTKKTETDGKADTTT